MRQPTPSLTTPAADPELASPHLARSAAGHFRAPWQVSFLALSMIWGCSFWWIKVGLEGFSFVDVAFIRVALGSLALLALTRVTRTRLPRGRRVWAHLFVLALAWNSLPFVLFAYGETHISAVLAGLINALTPLATLVIIMTIFRQQRPTPATVAGVVGGVAGALGLIGLWHGLGSGQLLGILACLGAVTCYGVAFPYSRRHLAGVPEGPVALATGQVICSTIQLLPFAALSGHAAASVPGASLLALAALGMLGSGLAYALNYHVVIAASSTIASTVTYVIPVFAVAVGAVFLSEAVAWYEPVGGMIVLWGAALSQGRLRLRAAVDRSPRGTGLNA